MLRPAPTAERALRLAPCACLAILAGLSGWPAPQAAAQQPVVIRPAVASAQPEALPAPPAGQPAAGGLTHEELAQLALANNPSLARAQALVAAARGNWLQVGLPPNPAVGYEGQQLGSGGRAEQHALVIEQEIVTGRKLALAREVACQEVIRAEQQLAAQQQRVLTDVQLAFYEALLAQRRLEVTQELLKIARLGLTTAERIFKQGETSRIDLLQASLEVESAEIELTKATNRHTAVWQSLAAVVGIPQMPPTALRGDLEATPAELTWEASLQRLLTTSPEIAAAVATIDRNRWAVARARAEPIPNVQFLGAVMQDNGIDGRTDGTVQMLLPLPLINRNQGAIRQAQSELIAAEWAIQQLELDLQSRLAPVFERYSTSASQVRRYRERILPTAQQSLDLVRRAYEAGEFPYLNLLSAQRTFFQTNLQYLESLRELRLSAAEIEGLLLRGSLGASP